MYGKRSLSRDWLSSGAPITYNLLYNKYYIDEIYGATIVKATSGISLILRFLEKYIVEGIVSLVAGIVAGLGRLGSSFQNGQVQRYGAVAFVGLAILVVVFAVTGGYLK